MKYGLIVYKDTENLGDDVQSYAALRFLPQIDYIIDREDISSFYPKEKEYVATIMNAWWLNKKFNWPPSPYILPYLISMHFTHWDTTYNINFDFLEGCGIEYLKKYGEVGCRDQTTLDILQKRNVNSYLSGCLTLTLEKFDNIEKDDYILLVDVSPEVEKSIKDVSNNKIINFSNKISKDEYSDLNWEERKLKVESYLKLIQGAKAVITTRLHCALPALALETPVLLITIDDAIDRISTYLPYVNYCTENELINKINTEKDIVINENKKDYIEIRKELIEKCNSFVTKMEKNMIDNSRLPEINMFKDYVNVNKFQKSLLLKSINNLQKKYEQEIIKNQDVWASRNKLQEEYDKLYNEFYKK